MAEQYRVDFENSCALLRDILLRRMPGAGHFSTSTDGFVLHRYDTGTEPTPYFYEPVVIVVAQGRKHVHIGAEDIAYGERSCFVAGVNMPVSSCVMEASAGKPYLSMSLNLDRNLIAALAAKVPPANGRAETSSGTAGAMVQELDPELLDAFLRLLQLTEEAERAEVLASLVVQEIHYRLLTGPFGRQLRMLNTFGSQSNQISQAIAWLKDNFTSPLHVDDLAGRLNMATSTFHKHFKEITTVSPLQYQKRLRLGEAQRLMLTGNYDVTQAALAVGYESPTQFNREYKRLFGETPRKDVLRIKADPADMQAVATA